MICSCSRWQTVRLLEGRKATSTVRGQPIGVASGAGRVVGVWAVFQLYLFENQQNDKGSARLVYNIQNQRVMVLIGGVRIGFVFDSNPGLEG